MTQETETPFMQTYHPVYTETTLKLMPIKERRKNHIKTVLIFLTTFIVIILIGLTCYKLRNYLLNTQIQNSIEDLDKKLEEIDKKVENEIRKIQEIDDYEDDPSTTIKSINKNLQLDHRRSKFGENSCGPLFDDPKIQHGDIARLNEFPWIVALFYLNTTSGEKVPVYGCGGSLIRDDLILTAAHCLVETKDIKL